jgi:hypothetical protein
MKLLENQERADDIVKALKAVSHCSGAGFAVARMEDQYL